MNFTSGEIQRKIAPQLLHEIKNDKYDFMSVIPDAPKEAIKAEGLDFNLVTHNAVAEINRSTAFDDGDLLELDIKKGIVPWDTFTTTPHKVTKDEIRAAAFEKRSEVRMQHATAIKRKNREYLLDKLAIADGTNANRPVLKTTGEVVSGRKRLTVNDLIVFMTALTDLGVPDEDRYIVLCNDHLADLLIDTIDNQDFRNLYHDSKTGGLKELYSFKFFWGAKPKILYSATDVKKAIGSVKGATDQYASIFFYAPNTVKGYGNVMTHYKPMEDDTRNNPAKDEFRVTGNICGDVKQDIATASIVSANA